MSSIKKIYQGSGSKKVCSTAHPVPGGRLWCEDVTGNCDKFGTWRLSPWFSNGSAQPGSSKLGNHERVRLTAAGFSEVGDWTELGVDRPSTEPSIVQVGDGFGRVLLCAELDVDVAHEVVAQVVADVHFFNLAVPWEGADEKI